MVLNVGYFLVIMSSQFVAHNIVDQCDVLWDPQKISMYGVSIMAKSKRFGMTLSKVKKVNYSGR